jgi:hypothetical protein
MLSVMEEERRSLFEPAVPHNPPTGPDIEQER